MELTEVIQGRLYRVMLTPRAHQDLCGCGIRQTQDGCTKNGVIGEVEQENGLGKKKVIRLFTRIKKYADSGKLSVPEHLNNESDGFFAFKYDQLRAYWWREGILIIISHFCKKKRQKLSRKDADLMSEHRRTYREEVE